MPHRDDHRGHRNDEHRDWRRDDDRRDLRRQPEGRSFGETGRYNSDVERYRGPGERRLGDNEGHTGEGEAWRRERLGSRYDEDRAGYGGGRSSGRPQNEASGHGYGRGYAGQEYGVEAGGYGSPGRGPGPAARGRQSVRYDRQGGGPGHIDYSAGANEPYGDTHLEDGVDRGMRQYGIPHDYAFHPSDDEFGPDYLSWREEQLRAHDRDYAGWRAEQQRRYDEDYRAWRGERRQQFGQTFTEWREQRNNLAAGAHVPGIAPGGPGSGPTTAEAGGYGDAGRDRPSGMPSGLSGMTDGPAGAAAAPRGPGSGRTAASGGADTGFTQGSPQVQAVTEGHPGKLETDDDKKKAKDKDDDRRS